MKALYVIDEDFGNDPATSETLSRLDCIVVHASNENGLTAVADVVLASSTYAEKNGKIGRAHV